MILLVDDNVSLSKTIKSFLEKMNLSCLVAHSVSEAVNLIYSHSFTLIITDIEMPEEDGFSLMYKLQQSAEYSTIPVIVMSGSTDMKYRKLAKDLGVKFFLEKPFSLSYLHKTIMVHNESNP